MKSHSGPFRSLPAWPLLRWGVPPRGQQQIPDDRKNTRISARYCSGVLCCRGSRWSRGDERTRKGKVEGDSGVPISLQIEDETAGSAQVAVLATAEGTISRATAKQLTLKFSVPEDRTLLNQGFSTMMGDSKSRESLNNTDLVAAIRGGAEGVRAGRKMIDLTDSEIEYEVDFVLTRSLSGGVDIKVWGVVGVTASATWTRRDHEFGCRHSRRNEVKRRRRS